MTPGDGPHREPGADYDLSRSQALLARIRRCEALLEARPGMFFTGYDRVGGHPVFVDRAKGAYLWDVDGNRYIDYLLGFGSVVLGHAHPEVTAAAVAELERGVNPTLLGRAHVALAERLVALIPAAERVTFLRTGSDATDAAVRLARAVTGRRLALHWGQHGWHDWSASRADGVLDAVGACTLPLRYNDLEHARRLFAAHGDDVACVIVMPYEIDAPEAGFLQGLQALARHHGALFVLDEVRSGFRIALGGAQQYFGLEPDLSAFSKAMANGHAISALAGRAAIMGQILKLGLTVTFYRSPDVMAASLATLDVLERENGPARLAALGERLMRGLDAAAGQAGVPARMVGFPATPFLRFEHRHANVRDKAMRLFCNGMLRRGVLMTPAHHWFVCTGMTQADIDDTVAAAREVLSELESRL